MTMATPHKTLLTGAVILGLLAFATMAAAQDAGVTVLRGIPVATDGVDVNEAEGQTVTVVRGQPVFVQEESQGQPVEVESELEAVEGFNGWFIDRKNNRIGNCFRVNTYNVGQSRIDCVWKRL